MKEETFIQEATNKARVRITEAVRDAEAQGGIPYVYAVDAHKAEARDPRNGDLLAVRRTYLELAPLLNRRADRYVPVDTTPHEADGDPVTVAWLIEKHEGYVRDHVREFGTT
jgi:hypothetical protein